MGLRLFFLPNFPGGYVYSRVYVFPDSRVFNLEVKRKIFWDLFLIYSICNYTYILTFIIDTPKHQFFCQTGPFVGLQCWWTIVKQPFSSKVRLSYGSMAYFSDIFISSRNVVISQNKWQYFCQKGKYRKNMQADHNLNGL